MRTLINSDSYRDITWGIKLHAGNSGCENHALTLPYWCAFLLPRLLADDEDGLECFVPCCDYFEGNFSAAYYRVDGGRYMWKIYEKSPDVMRRAIDPATRVPFFEMVFHDCISSYWYWTDYNNRFEDTWWQRDLLNAIAGTPPMYFFTRDVFARQKARLAASVKIAARTAKATADAMLVDWRWLTPDRLVQRSIFSNGVTVTANFSERPYDLGNGRILAPRTCAEGRLPGK